MTMNHKFFISGTLLQKIMLRWRTRNRHKFRHGPRPHYYHFLDKINFRTAAGTARNFHCFCRTAWNSSLADIGRNSLSVLLPRCPISGKLLNSAFLIWFLLQNIRIKILSWASWILLDQGYEEKRGYNKNGVVVYSALGDKFILRYKITIFKIHYFK